MPGLMKYSINSETLPTCVLSNKQNHLENKLAKAKVYRFLALILLLLLIVSLTLVQNKILVSAISRGGEKSLSTSFILGSTICEPFIGKTVGSANQHNIGLWHVYRQSTITEVKKKEETVPTLFKIEQNCTNPLNPSTKIKYSIPDNVILSGARNLQDLSTRASRNYNTKVTLKVFDVLGKGIAILVDEYKPAGRYEVKFSASSLSGGVYFYQLQAGKYVNTKKMNLLK